MKISLLRIEKTSRVSCTLSDICPLLQSDVCPAWQSVLFNSLTSVQLDSLTSALFYSLTSVVSYSLTLVPFGDFKQEIVSICSLSGRLSFSPISPNLTLYLTLSSLPVARWSLPSLFSTLNKNGGWLTSSKLPRVEILYHREYKSDIFEKKICLFRKLMTTVLCLSSHKELSAIYSESSCGLSLFHIHTHCLNINYSHSFAIPTYLTKIIISKFQETWTY